MGVFRFALLVIILILTVHVHICVYPQKWARAYRDGSYHAMVNTNNGVESLKQGTQV